MEAALAHFALDVSPAKGQHFFDLLVAYVADYLGFEAAVVGELAADGGTRLVPIAEYPRATHETRAMIGSHCDRLAASGFAVNDSHAGAHVDVPLVGCDGRPIGAICGFGRAGLVDASTTAMLFRILGHRAAAELERQRARRELERRDALFLGLIAEAHDVVGVIDDHGAFTALSPAIERVLGYPVADCVGLEVVALVHALDRPAVEALLRISGSVGYSVEARMRKMDGGWLTMELTYAEHEDAAGRRFKVVSARDLTDRRLLEDRLRQSQKTEIIGRLASGIVHDFGNILMVVGTHADLMRLRAAPGDPCHADMDAIQAAVTRGADLARQLLAFSRHHEFETRRMDINASIEQLTVLLRRLVGSKIRLETDLAPEARYIVADPTQIEQIVLNLTLNARDAMPNGGSIRFVTAPVGPGPLPPAVAAAPDAYVCFSVIDTGCGIRDDVKARIFEPLFTTKHDGSGTGIGLATVHDIVTRHRGSIEVVSAEGRGTTFRVYLPRNVAPARKTGTAAAPIAI